MFVLSKVSENADGDSMTSNLGYIMRRVYFCTLIILDSSSGRDANESGSDTRDLDKKNFSMYEWLGKTFVLIWTTEFQIQTLEPIRVAQDKSASDVGQSNQNLTSFRTANLVLKKWRLGVANLWWATRKYLISENIVAGKLVESVKMIVEGGKV